MNQPRSYPEIPYTDLPWVHLRLLPQVIGLAVLLILGGQQGAAALLIPVVRELYQNARATWRRTSRRWPSRMIPHIVFLLVTGHALAGTPLRAQSPEVRSKGAVTATCGGSLPAIYDRVSAAALWSA